MKRTFDTLRRGAPARLAKFRADAAKLAANLHRNMHVAANPTWRTVRYSKFSEPYPHACRGTNPGNKPVISSQHGESSLPVRSIRFADEIANIGHDGWYADAEGYGDRGTVRGIVAGLSHGRFLSGYYWSDVGEYVLYLSEVFTDEKDAARDADEEARIYAEACQEDDARFRAMIDAEGLVEAKESDLREAWEDYRAIWSAFLADRVTHAKAAIRARESLSDLVSDLRAARRDLADATAAYERVE